VSEDVDLLVVAPELVWSVHAHALELQLACDPKMTSDWVDHIADSSSCGCPSVRRLRRGLVILLLPLHRPEPARPLPRLDLPARPISSFVS
jgi:hypothetical protein